MDVPSQNTPYVRFDLNDYSIPHTHVRRTLQVVATQKRVRVLDGNEVIATHARSFDGGQQIEEPSQIEGLVAHKRADRAHRALDRLHPRREQCQRALQARRRARRASGTLTRGLIDLLDSHRAVALEVAIAAALREQAAHLGAVCHFIDQQRARRGQAPPIAITLPKDPRVRSLTVRPHSLMEYEQLLPENAHEHTDEHVIEPTGHHRSDEPER